MSMADSTSLPNSQMPIKIIFGLAWNYNVVLAIEVLCHMNHSGIEYTAPHIHTGARNHSLRLSNVLLENATDIWQLSYL